MADRVPIAFIVDDPPLNSAYWLRRQSEEMGIAGEPRGSFGKFVADWRQQEPSAIIPNDFWHAFADWALAAGVKGKFSLLPCPSGLGTLDDKVEGYTADELAELIAIVRDELMGPFDITPEIWTHTMAWDMAARKLLPVTEFDWMAEQDEDTLAAYMAGAVAVLQNVGIRATGITQPCNFRGDESLYVRAVLRAMTEAADVRHTFYFLHCEAETVPVPCRVMIDDAEHDQSVVSIVSGIRPDEPFWQSLYGEGDVKEMAEYFITADGRSGRLVDLANSGGPVVFHAHGQTLFSNGTRKGFESLKIVVARINEHLADRVTWMTIQELARWTREQSDGNGES